MIIKREYKLNIVMGICTRGVFPALDFTADFPPAAPGFYQRTQLTDAGSGKGFE